MKGFSRFRQIAHAVHPTGGGSGSDPGVVSDTVVSAGGFCGASSDGVCATGYSCESLAFDQICTEICVEDADCLVDFGDDVNDAKREFEKVFSKTVVVVKQR